MRSGLIYPIVMDNRLKIILSFVLLLYCILLVGMSHFDIRPGHFLLALFELITIPVLILICFLIVKFFLDLRKQKFKSSTKGFLPILMLIVAVIILVLATVLDI